MNRIKLITLGVFALTALASKAQTLVFQAKSVENQLWGYSNMDGELIIPGQYDKCYPFSSNGLAVIYDEKERQYHFIDVKNQRLTTNPAKFKIKDGMGFNVSGFNDHLFLVQVNNKWGYMNDEGNLAIQANYDNGSDFNGGFATVGKGKQFLVVDTKGNETPLESGITEVKEFSDGLAPVRMSNKKYGFIDTKGKLAVPAEYETVGYFAAGLAWVKTAEGKLGYIDKSGQWVIKPEFEAGKEFDPVSGLARVKKGESWCYVDKSGKILYVKDTESWGDFSEGLADGKKGGMRGFYDKTGKWVIEPKFLAVRDFHNGYAAAKSVENKWGIIDKTGKWAVEAKFDSVKDVTLIK
jgi:hypothetical protein